MYRAAACPAAQHDAYILRYLGEKVCSHALPWSVSLINASAGHAVGPVQPMLVKLTNHNEA
ncbi:hypothetical protein G52EAM_00147 [Candidatus Nanoperiomorbus periodonticus]|nr:hypothetical protein G52EAM_00147 [Candidatus Nanoperiomorbus periodonticus]